MSEKKLKEIKNEITSLSEQSISINSSVMNMEEKIYELNEKIDILIKLVKSK